MVFKGNMQQSLFAAIDNLRALRVRCVPKMLLSHVLGHNFVPYAFQKPRLAPIRMKTVPYIYRSH